MLCTWMFGISNYSTESTNLRVLNCRIPGERLILFTENANYFQILQGWVVIASPLVSWSLCNFRNICLIGGNFFFFSNELLGLADYECVRLTKWHQYIFSVSLMFGAYYITGQWGEFIKRCYFMLLYTYLGFFCFST